MFTGFPLTPRVGLEPTTPRLTAACSTIELSRKVVNSLCELTTEELFHNSSSWILPKRSLLRRLTIRESLRNSLHNSSKAFTALQFSACSFMRDIPSKPNLNLLTMFPSSRHNCTCSGKNLLGSPERSCSYSGKNLKGSSKRSCSCSWAWSFHALVQLFVLVKPSTD